MHDGDLADELEPAHERGLDVLQIPFESTNFGITLGAQIGADGVPVHLEGFAWTKATSLKHLQIGANVRVLAKLFGAAVRDETGLDWRTAHLYGICQGRGSVAQTVEVLYPDGEAFDSHYSHCEVGEYDGDSGGATPRGAVVLQVEALGVAANQLVQTGLELLDVGGIAAPTLLRATELLANATATAEAPLVVSFRRPSPDSARRGEARKKVCSRPTYNWSGDIAGSLDVLLENPVNNRRISNVYNAFLSTYEFGVDDSGLPMMPTRAVVEKRMMAIWKKKTKVSRDQAQNKAARGLARAARAAGVDDGDEDEVVSDEDDEDDDGDGDDEDADADMGLTTDVGATAVGHYAQISSLGVTELRRRLREERGEKTPLASVRATDLSSDDLATGSAKALATLELLRHRLAAVYAENDDETAVET